jgi:uncharacterized DUF497 family protein
MALEWDPNKERVNRVKHGIQFADAVSALEDENALTMRDERTGEERWVTIGMDSLARVVVVVYVWRGERIRLISARRATPNELEQYEAGI